MQDLPQYSQLREKELVSEQIIRNSEAEMEALRKEEAPAVENETEARAEASDEEDNQL